MSYSPLYHQLRYCFLVVQCAYNVLIYNVSHSVSLCCLGVAWRIKNFKQAETKQGLLRLHFTFAHDGRLGRNSVYLYIHTPGTYGVSVTEQQPRQHTGHSRGSK